jgi:hypothetical protein
MFLSSYIYAWSWYFIAAKRVLQNSQE